MSISRCVWDAATALGFTSLKPEQEEAITQFTLGRDVFVALPTGNGKSLCYYCLPYVFDSVRKVENKSIVLVISPLVALMKDQVTHCRSRGLTADFVSSVPDDQDMRKAVYGGKYQIVFISTESLFTGRRWREMLKDEPYRSNLIAFVVDEAHCVN